MATKTRLRAGRAVRGLPTTPVQICTFWRAAFTARRAARAIPGQVAVGAVVLNHVESSQFPNTISGVIYQKGAFTAVDDGQINLTPDQTAINAARDAMNGWDPTYGCLYYYNPATATSSWIFSRQTVTTIGRHVFAI